MIPAYLAILEEVLKSKGLNMTYGEMEEVYEKDIFLSHIYENNDTDTFRKACELFVEVNYMQSKKSDIVQYQINKVIDVLKKKQAHGTVNVIASRTKLSPEIVKSLLMDGEPVGLHNTVKIVNSLGYTFKLVSIEHLVVEDIAHHELMKNIKMNVMGQLQYEKYTKDEDFPLYEHVGGKVQMFDNLNHYSALGEIQPLGRDYEAHKKGTLLLAVDITIPDEIIQAAGKLHEDDTVMVINNTSISARILLSVIKDDNVFSALVIVGTEGKLQDTVVLKYVNPVGKNIIKTIHLQGIEVDV